MTAEQIVGGGAMTLDEFLNHQPSDRGGGASYFKWIKRNPPVAHVWLHTGARILSLWQHGWPRIVDRTDKESGEKVLDVWGGSWNCWEPEAVLRRQYHRDRETGERRAPPSVCPMCLLIERVRTAIDQGQVSWTDPVFRFDVGSSNDRVLHAGGLYNAFGKNDLTQDEIAQLRDARIYRKEAWKENAMAKCAYVFTIVDNDAPGEGVRVALENSGLGDKVKAAIRDQMTRLGTDAGNPIRSPYCIRWEHHPNEERFDQKYRAIAMDKIPLTAEIKSLICDSPALDTTRVTMPGNVAQLRSVMEQRWCGPDGLVDWDEIFSAAESLEKTRNGGGDATSFDYGANVAASAPRAPAPTPQAAKESAVKAGIYIGIPKMPDQPPASSDDELVACDDCGQPMNANDSACPRCGRVYDEPPAEEPPAPAPVQQLRSRSAAKEASIAQPAAVVAAKPAARAAVAKPAPKRAPTSAPKPAAKVTPPPADANDEWGIAPEDDGLPF